jgi:hypothetical protein
LAARRAGTARAARVSVMAVTTTRFRKDDQGRWVVQSPRPRKRGLLWLAFSAAFLPLTLLIAWIR